MHTFAQKSKTTQQTTPTKSMISGRANFGQNHMANSILHLHHMIGNQAVQRLLKANLKNVKGHDVNRSHDSSNNGNQVCNSYCSLKKATLSPFYSIGQVFGLGTPIQAKLKIDKPNDKYIQETDRVAEQVMSMPDSQVQRQCGSVEECHPDLEDYPNIKRTGGRSPVFACRPAVGKAQQELNICFGRGYYTPGTYEGKRLLAHELVHVLQQRVTGSHRRAMPPFLHQTRSYARGFRGLQLAPRNRVPRLPRRVRPSILSYTVTTDPNIATGVTFRSLQAFKNAIMRIRRRRPWTLHFAMHGDRNHVCYNRPPNATCFNANQFQRIFFGRRRIGGWRAWRNRFGPTNIVLYVCNLNPAMRNAVVTTLRRPPGPGGRRVPVGRRPNLGQCTFRTVPIEIKVQTTIRRRAGYHIINSRRMYRRIPRQDRLQFWNQLRPLGNHGYGRIPPICFRNNDRRLARYYFDEPPFGAWSIDTVTCQQPMVMIPFRDPLWHWWSQNYGQAACP